MVRPSRDAAGRSTRTPPRRRARRGPRVVAAGTLACLGLFLPGGTIQ